MKQVKQFLAFMSERQKIYRKKQAGEPRPWTRDPILNSCFFCNVFREQDTNTIWIKKNWRDPYADHPMLPLAMALARSINYIPTLEELGFPEKWDRARFLRIIAGRKARGEQWGTAAHVIAPGKPGKPGEPKEYRIARTLDGTHELFKHSAQQGAWDESCTLQGMFEALTQTGIDGMGPFTAYEIVTDLRYTKWLCHAPDRMTWCNISIGSLRGLNRVMGRDVHATGVSKAQLLEEARSLLPLMRKLDDPAFKKAEMREIEHSLCEFDKYLRVKDGGRARRTYPR